MDTISLISSVVAIYVDLFLLYLLYRFMKPQPVLENGATVIQTVLFAHDHEIAGQNLESSMRQIDREREE